MRREQQEQEWLPGLRLPAGQEPARRPRPRGRSRKPEQWIARVKGGRVVEIRKASVFGRIEEW